MALLKIKKNVKRRRKTIRVAMPYNNKIVTKQKTISILLIFLILVVAISGFVLQVLRTKAFPDEQCIHIANLTEGRNNPGAARGNNGKIYIFGGWRHGGTTIIEIYDPANPTNDAIKSLAQLSYGRSTPGAAPNASGNFIYIFGGSDNTIDKYDIVNDTCVRISTTLPWNLGYIAESAALASNGKIYIFGGYHHPSYRDEILEFDPATETIVDTGARLPNPRSDVVAVTFGDYIYLFGGEPLTNQILRYDPANPSVNPVLMSATLPTPRIGAGGAALGNFIYIFGGYDQSKIYDEILEYDPIADTLSIRPVKMVQPISRLAVEASLATGKIYTFGGGYDGSLLKIIQEYTPPSHFYYSISGYIKKDTVSLTNVKVNLTGDKTETTYTDANGFYEFFNIPSGSNVTVTPSKSGWTFTPPSRNYPNVNQNYTNQDFQGTETGIPEVINYHGKLTDSGGNPLTGTYNFTFRLYDAESGGNLVWGPEPHASTTVTDGYFNVKLGSILSFDSAGLDFTKPYWLSIEVNGDGEMTPRVQLTTFGYAFTAQGLYRQGENITIQTDISGNIILQPAGNVQLTASNTSPALLINQQGTGNILEIQDGGTSVLTVADGGNVGIGMITPGAKLDVAGRIWQTNIGYSVFLGEGAGKNDDLTDNKNVFIGYEAGRSNKTGHSNTFLGYQAGYSNAIARYNTFLGYQAGYSNVNKNDNTFLGYMAGYSNTDGDANTFVGSKAGYSNTTGRLNTFLGYRAGYSNTSGEANTFLGFDAGYFNTTGRFNTFLGYNAGYNNADAQYNTFLGFQAGSSNRGNNNTFLGSWAGYNNSTGHNNIFLSYSAGQNNTSGYYNTFLGPEAGFSNTSGNSNIFLGYKAGYNITTGSKNIIIGVNQQAPAENTSNFLNIGGAIYGNLSTGNVGIGTTDQFGNGQGVLSLANARTIPSTILTNAALFYASSGEMYVYDSAGNATLLSPHNNQGEWIFKSENRITGRSIEINMEEVVRTIEELSGKALIKENGKFVADETQGTSTESFEKDKSLLTKITETIQKKLAKLGLFIENGIAKVKELFVDRVTTKEIQLIDKATGEIYCTWIENGEWKKVKGECEPKAVVCTPNWSCSQWQPAPEKIACGQTFTQTRVCNDLNECDTQEGKPIEEQKVIGTNNKACGITSCDTNLNLVGECQNICLEGICQTCIPTCTCAEGFLDCDNDMTNGCEFKMETSTSTCP
jgi:hypothetical protein